MFDIKEYIVPMIAAGVYLLLLMIKPFLGEKSKFLPLIAGVLGVFLNAWANAGFGFAIFLCGMASGLGATGIDQLLKQTTGYYDEVNEDDEIDGIGMDPADEPEDDVIDMTYENLPEEMTEEELKELEGE